MAKGHGGARDGAGRKPKSEKYAGSIVAAEDRIAKKDRLLKCVDNLHELADGGYQRVKEEWRPAGLVFVDEQATQVMDIGGVLTRVPIFNRSGAPVMVKVRAFPDLEPDELVCVSRTTELADRDRLANEYLINRILGKPTESVEHTGKDGGAIEQVHFYLPSNGRDAATDGDEAGRSE